ncbi:hypothetical protein BDZ91DRAFT_721903 [Kalaharituber pfeilii]|nr:hypothetical protein BDZ91DRAFT_721903 [Kalaharituber pfeilii]
MSLQRINLPWTRDEVHRLVMWMEENPEALRGKQIGWHKDVKDEVFANDDHITVKKIGDKAMNMKKAWREAKALQERNGWSIKPEENEQSINDALERKCTFFWRLEGIWGSRSNSAVIAIRESMQAPSRPNSKVVASRESLRAPSRPSSTVIASRESIQAPLRPNSRVVASRESIQAPLRASPTVIASRESIQTPSRQNLRVVASRESIQAPSRPNSTLIASRESIQAHSRQNSKLIASRESIQAPPRPNLRVIASRETIQTPSRPNLRAIASREPITTASAAPPALPQDPQASLAPPPDLSKPPSPESGNEFDSSPTPPRSSLTPHQHSVHSSPTPSPAPSSPAAVHSNREKRDPLQLMKRFLEAKQALKNEREVKRANCSDPCRRTSEANGEFCTNNGANDASFSTTSYESPIQGLSTPQRLLEVVVALRNPEVYHGDFVVCAVLLHLFPSVVLVVLGLHCYYLLVPLVLLLRLPSVVCF